MKPMLGPEVGPGGPAVSRRSRSKGVGPEVPPGCTALLMSMLPNMFENGSVAATHTDAHLTSQNG